MSAQHKHTTRQSDYFSISPLNHTHHYDHFSTESPCCSPALSPTEVTSFAQHPLLARRESISYTMPAASLLQLQTSAAHGSSSPSRPQHIQNVLHVTSDDSTSSDSSKSSVSSSYSTPEFARCSRCQRTPSIDYKTGKSNMITYGLNSYYCNRCAGMVGLTKS